MYDTYELNIIIIIYVHFQYQFVGLLVHGIVVLFTLYGYKITMIVFDITCNCKTHFLVIQSVVKYHLLRPIQYRKIKDPRNCIPIYHL